MGRMATVNAIRELRPGIGFRSPSTFGASSVRYSCHKVEFDPRTTVTLNFLGMARVYAS